MARVGILGTASFNGGGVGRSFIGGVSPEETRGFESGIGGGHRAWGDAAIEGAERGRTIVGPKGEAAIAFVGVSYL